MSSPRSGALEGTASDATMPVTTGKRMTVAFDTGPGLRHVDGPLRFFVVSSRMIGGWMMGTSDM
jgi:hypothetical protein